MNKLVYQIMIISGAVFISVAVILYGYGLVDDFFAGRRAGNLTLQMPGAGDVYNPVEGEDAIFAQIPVKVEPVTYKGLEFNIIGFISIPKLKIRLPVIDRVTDDLLKISVCWYGGEMKPEPVRMIFTAHNYRSHFGQIDRLVPGDEVFFQTNSGIIYTYQVLELIEIDEENQAGLDQGDWDLTLLTCTKDRVRRLLVRCVLM